MYIVRILLFRPFVLNEFIVFQSLMMDDVQIGSLYEGIRDFSRSKASSFVSLTLYAPFAAKKYHAVAIKVKKTTTTLA